MADTVLQLDPRDNVLVALVPLESGAIVGVGAETIPVAEPIPAKHKLARVALAPGEQIYL